MMRFVSWNPLVGLSFVVLAAWWKGIVSSQEDDCRVQKYQIPVHNKRLINHILKQVTVTAEDDCGFHCFMDDFCVSYNIGRAQDGVYMCEPSSSDHVQHPGDFEDADGYSFYGTENACQSHRCLNNAACQSGFTAKGYRCVCPQGYRGTHCENDVDECNEISHDCDANAICENVAGSFVCSCKTGYRGNGTTCEVIVSKDCSELYDKGMRKSDVYEINGGGPETFSVFCDMNSTGGGWTMVFKAVSGMETPNVGSLWLSNETMSDNTVTALDNTNSFNRHYKNRIVLNWEDFNPQEVRVALYEGGLVKRTLLFNAANSHSNNWFTSERLVNSSWSDLQDAVVPIFLLSSSVSERSFEIGGDYSGCDSDWGWLAITRSHCLWETRLPLKSSILYCNLERQCSWNDYAEVEVADVLAVFVR